MLEIGGTHVSAALVDLANNEVMSATLHTGPIPSDGSRDDIVEAILDPARALDVGHRPAWGVAIPGPFDYDAGIARFADVAKFDALNGFDLGRAIRIGLGDAAGEVFFLNDADAFALGEWAAGTAAGHTRTICLTLGTGVGSAFLDQGRLVLNGPDVPPNGDVYLLRVDGRPLEDLVSRRAIRRRYARLSGRALTSAIDVREIADFARDGDQIAMAVISGAVNELGQALAPWVARFGATAVIVGGSISRSWDLIERPLLESFRSHEEGLIDRVAVIQARRPDESALVGAAHHAHRRGSRGR